MERLQQLSEIQPSVYPFMGDRTVFLSELDGLGYPIIPTLMIPPTWYGLFLNSIDWLEPLLTDLPDSVLHLNPDNAQQLQAIAQNIRHGILNNPLPMEWLEVLEQGLSPWSPCPIQFSPSIVGNLLGNGANWSQLANYHLNRSLDFQFTENQVDGIAHALKQCWAEPFRARNLLCWQRYGLSLHHFSIGVMAQPVPTVLSSGTLSLTADELILEAIWGLNFANQRGEERGEVYHMELESGHLITHHFHPQAIAYLPHHQTQPPIAREPQYQTQHGEGSPASVPHPSLEPHLFPPAQPYPPLRFHPSLPALLLHQSSNHPPVLNGAQLANFVHLAKQLRHHWGVPLTVEWMLQVKEPEQPPHISITSAYPYLLQFIPQPRDPLTSSSATEVAATPSHHQSLETTKIQSAPPLARGTGITSGVVTAVAYVIHSPTIEHLHRMPPGNILIARSILPSWLPWLSQCAGMVTEEAGMTSHCAILARELNIPAIVGVTNVTHLIQCGDLLTIEAPQGIIHRVHQKKPLVKKSSSHPFAPTPIPVHEHSSLPVISTQLMVNLNHPSTLSQITQLPIDGIGLIRSELMLLDIFRHRHPLHWVEMGDEKRLSHHITTYLKKIARMVAPRPVFYRSLDLRSHEFPSLDHRWSQEKEVNPILGMRGTLSYCHDPRLFNIELDAVVQLQRQGVNNLHLMLPFVRTVEEFQFCRQLAVEAGIDFTHLQCWIMAEVPSVLFLLPEYVNAGVQGVAIGMNDLTQLVLGIDRGHRSMNHLFTENHLGVKRAIAHLIQTAKNLGIPSSICNSTLANDPDLVADLVRWGITTISVEGYAIDQTYQAIVKAEARLPVGDGRFYPGLGQ